MYGNLILIYICFVFVLLRKVRRLRGRGRGRGGRGGARGLARSPRALLEAPGRAVSRGPLPWSGPWAGFWVMSRKISGWWISGQPWLSLGPRGACALPGGLRGCSDARTPGRPARGALPRGRGADSHRRASPPGPGLSAPAFPGRWVDSVPRFCLAPARVRSAF